MKNTTSDHDNHKNLLDAFIRIRDVFSSFGEGSIGGLSLYQAEDLVQKELFTLYNSCQSMARDIITKKICGAYSSYRHCDDRDVDIAAADAIRNLFGHRKIVSRKSKSPTGVLEIVGVVQKLYEINPEPKGKDACYWLRKTVSNHVSHYNYSQLKEKNPEYANTGKKISRFLKNSGRYECEGRIVRDTAVEFEDTECRQASADEIISLCGQVEPQPTNIPAAVDLIFDLLADQVKFRSEVLLGALRVAVFTIIEPRLPSWFPNVSQKTPWDDLLIGRAEKAAIDTLDEVAASYAWRKEFADFEKSAFLEAGKDYLFDIVYLGEPSMSLHKYLAAHLEDCTSVLYETVYKGSAQHFFKYLLEDWRRRMTNVRLEKFDKDKKSPDAERERGDI